MQSNLEKEHNRGLLSFIYYTKAFINSKKNKKISCFSCSGTVPSPARFHTLTTWNSEKGAEWVDTGAIQFHDFVMVNNEKASIDMKFIKGTGYGYERGAMVRGGLMVGHTESISPAGFETEVGMVGVLVEIS